MIEKVCNLWLEPAEFRCIPTSGAIGPDGSAMMDSPIAVEAAKRFAGIETDLGRLIAARGNHVHLIRPGLVSFPIKQFQWSAPALPVITRSAQELAALVGTAKTLLPRPGVGPGGLNWEDVAKALAALPDNIIVIQHA
jgi:hypothetical protein